jgi:tetratricopeptide (TPR) repeat protein
MVVLEAFGDPDDHLRLSTLIADAVVSSTDNVWLRGVARRLTEDPDPRSWRDRSSDFTELLVNLPSDTLVLRDPDAFAETIAFDRANDWDDANLCRERSEFFHTLITPIARRAIWLERTAPDPRVSEQLAVAPASSPDARIDVSDPYASSIGPDARGALAWLLHKKVLSEGAVDELIELGVGPALDRHIVLVTYDHLPPATRAAAYRLAVLRGEQPLNGAIGPFALRARSAGEAISKAHVDELLECGFLRSTREGVRIPRIVRDVVLSRADAEDPESVEDDHRKVFEGLRRSGDPERVDLLIERHHHAVRGLLFEEAVATARFYATDLRELALRLSLKNQWVQAAAVYRKIVELDPQDAYAWEYLGYNLLRADPARYVDEILKAYSNAVEHDPRNPLYHGRLLGFRGRLGQDITAEFQAGIELYAWRGIDRFASEVLKGLRRGSRDALARQLVTRNKLLLKHPEVKRIMSKPRGSL